MVKFDILLEYFFWREDKNFFSSPDPKNGAIRKTFEMSALPRPGDLVELANDDDLILEVKNSISFDLSRQEIEISFDVSGEVAVKAFLLSPGGWNTARHMSPGGEDFFLSKVAEAQK